MDRKLLDCSIDGGCQILRIDFLIALGNVIAKPVSFALSLGELAKQRAMELGDRLGASLSQCSDARLGLA